MLQDAKFKDGRWEPPESVREGLWVPGSAINRIFRDMTNRFSGPRGFHEVQKEISHREHLPMKRAGAILAASARRASPEAKRRNPRLQNVKG